MPKAKLNETTVKALAPPPSGNVLYRDVDLIGFACRVTANGAKAFLACYTVAGKERRMTLGSFPAWSAAKAREQAKTVLYQASVGHDALGAKEEAKAAKVAADAAPTVATLCDLFLEKEVGKKRTTTQTSYRQLIVLIREQIGAIKLDAIKRADIEALHGRITAGTHRTHAAKKKAPRPSPFHANRTLILLKRMFNLAVAWELMSNNPVQKIDRNAEPARERFLSEDEISNLLDALDTYEAQASTNSVTANAIRLVLFTGARRMETLAARWTDFDLAGGLWIKPASTTKQKKVHRLHLSDLAVELVAGMKTTATARAKKVGVALSPYLFPARHGKSGHITEVKKAWLSVATKAGLEGVRLHDLRHTAASLLAARGASLKVIGDMLGHSSPVTTNRYSHLTDTVLKEAVQAASAAFKRKPRQADAELHASER